MILLYFLIMGTYLYKTNENMTFIEISNIFNYGMWCNRIKILELLLSVFMYYYIVYKNYSIIKDMRNMYVYIFVRKKEAFFKYICIRLLHCDLKLFIQIIFSETVFSVALGQSLSDLRLVFELMRVMLFVFLISIAGMLIFYTKRNITGCSAVTCVLIMLINIISFKFESMLLAIFILFVLAIASILMLMMQKKRYMKGIY